MAMSRRSQQWYGIVARRHAGISTSLGPPFSGGFVRHNDGDHDETQSRRCLNAGYSPGCVQHRLAAEHDGAGKRADRALRTLRHDHADAAGHAIPANKLIGADVTNAKREQVGSIDELLINNSGQVQGLVVSVGGFLGVGDRKVVLPWDGLSISRNGDQVVAVASATKDQLKAMPEYHPPKAKAASSAPMKAPAQSSSSMK